MSNDTSIFVEHQEESIRCFDNEGNEIEPNPRAEIHQKPFKIWHATTAIYLVNRKGELLCSKRSENYYYRPGYWQGCFGGHVKAGESYEQNAIKELYEEAGLKVKLEDLHFLKEVAYEHSKHRAKLFTYFFDGELEDLHCADGEITEFKWMDMDKFWQEKQKNGDVGAATCPPDVQEMIKELLNKQYA